MQTVRFWEEICANVWPAFDQLLYDGWLLRFSHGYSRNNNSVWPLYAGYLPLAHKIEFYKQQYAARSLNYSFRLAEIPEHAAIAYLTINESNSAAQNCTQDSGS